MNRGNSLYLHSGPITGSANRLVTSPISSLGAEESNKLASNSAIAVVSPDSDIGLGPGPVYLPGLGLDTAPYLGSYSFSVSELNLRSGEMISKAGVGTVERPLDLESISPPPQLARPATRSPKVRPNRKPVPVRA